METFGQLEALSDEALIERIDAAAPNVAFGPLQYLQLLAWRKADRQAATLTRLTVIIGVLTAANAILVAVDIFAH